jgi:glycosyl hydrolase family 99
MRDRRLSRRAFLAGCAAALGPFDSLRSLRAGPFDSLRSLRAGPFDSLRSLRAGPAAIQAQQGRRRQADDDTSSDRRLSRIGAQLRERFRDLHRHFIFEYYPWYGTSPWRHWDGSGRVPPGEISAADLPALGGYDSRSARVLEQHARWIVEAGVGAVNLSWWGRGSYEDESTHLVMDVMRAFDIKVTFHLEPYSGQRGARFADDVTYILREYGERRRWDALLLLENADRRAGPVFKTFVTLLSPTSTNCLGVTTPNDIFVPDDVWRQQMARVRNDFRADFDRITFVADSLDATRTRAAGFDAGAVGNPYIGPEEWPGLTDPFDRTGIPFSFAVNAGFDNVEPKTRPTDPCYRPAPFEPDLAVRWDVESSRESAHRLSASRVEKAFERTLAHQTDTRSANWRSGFLLVPINSFNEWHEGTAFEPMKSYTDLSAEERLLYHNPVDGSYRLDTLRRLMGFVF